MAELAVDALLARGRAANPGIDIDAETFRAFIVERLPPGRVDDDALAELRIEALYLACACAAGDARAIAAFDRAYGRDIERAVAWLGGSTSAAEEVRQVIRERLFTRTKDRPPRIVEYGGKGDLGRWVRAIATRIAIDLRRATRREIASDDDDLVERALPMDDPEIASIKARYAGELNQAVRDAVVELSVAAKNDLRLYYLDGLTLDEIARLDAVSAATVSRRLARARDTVLQRTRELLGERLRLELREVESILGVMGSRLEINASVLRK